MRKTVDTYYDHRPTGGEFVSDVIAAAWKGDVSEAYRFAAPGAVDPDKWVVRIHYEPVDEDLLADTERERELWHQ